MNDFEAITVTVGEVNSAPVLAAIGFKSIDEGVQLTFTASATDVDLPTQVLTYSATGLPSGASISGAGVFSWTPTGSQGSVTAYQITVRVTDDGAGALFDEETIAVTVNDVATGLLSDGFEATGIAWDDNWDGNGATAWDQSNTHVRTGSFSVRSDNNNDGALTTDTYSTSGATSITVSFWMFHTDISSADLRLNFRNNYGIYDMMVSIGNTGVNNVWTYYTFTTTNSQYMHTNFGVQITTNLGNGELVYIDDVIITKIP